MAKDVVVEAIKFLESEDRHKNNSALQKFCEKFSGAINNAYEKYEACIKENVQKERKVNSPDSNIICRINDENKQRWGGFYDELKSALTQDTKNCDYLLYWMSDEIAKSKYNTHRIIWLYNMFEEFWKNSTCCQKKESANINCDKPYEIEFDIKALKSKKGLYLLLDYYNNNKNVLKGESSEEKNSFCNYVKYMFNLYHHMDNEVNTHVHKKYGKELTLFQSKFQNEENLSELRTGCNYPNLSSTSQRAETNSKLSLDTKFERFIPSKDYLSGNRDNAPEGMNDILKNTNSYKLYEEFNKDVTDDKIKKYCEEFFKDKSNYKSESITLCKKIVNNFNNLYENKIKIDVNNKCLHYKNWVYQEIYNLITTKSEYDNTEKIIKKFLDLQNKKNVRSSEGTKICHYYFIFNDFMELNAKKEEKDLHDYFTYYYIIDKAITPNINEREKYQKYMQYILTLYMRHKIGWNCCDSSYGVDPLCRHYFKCEEEYNPSDLLDILNGAKKEDVKKKYKTPPVVVFGDQELSEELKDNDIMRIQYGRCTEIYNPDDRGRVFGLRCDYKARLPHYNNFVSALTDEKRKDDKESTTETEIKSSSTNNSSNILNTEEIESSPFHFKIGTSVVLGIGTVFIFFLYYRFTPFGSLFGKRGRGRRNFEDYFNEEYMQELSHTSEYEDVNPGNRRIQIAYQRT
ncbi:PIR protein [Plasmodium ovale]|uniref:PIR protein n=2 Tax=Plasmodium ovale TaxID=36330 RepID=A0A1D3JC72_PLAOA|nr:PIR protein [Plasmodium ovale]